MARHLRRNVPVSAWDDVPDPRDPRGVRYRLNGLLQGLLLGMLTGALTLRDVEALMEDLVVRQTLRVQGTPSDTTYDRIIRVLLAIAQNRVQTVQPAPDAQRCNPRLMPSGATCHRPPPVPAAPGVHR